MLQNTDHDRRTRDVDVQTKEITVKIQWTPGTKVLWRQKAAGLSAQAVGLWLLFRIYDYYIFLKYDYKYYNILITTVCKDRPLPFCTVFVNKYSYPMMAAIGSRHLQKN
jgi:hypothetical protein